jgi:hypothetical protein
MRYLFLILTCFAISFSQPKNEEFKEALAEAIQQMEKAVTFEEKQDLAGRLDIIASAASDEWLGHYYAALANVNLSFSKEIKDDSDKRDAFLAKALEEYKLINVENEEVMVLRAYIAQNTLAVKPMLRYKVEGETIAKYLEKAEKLAPNNPRVNLFRAMNTFYLPEFMGGGKKKSCPLFEKALVSYSNFKIPYQLYPNWGKDLAEEYLAKCK